MSLLTEASLVILPNAVKEGELLSIIPADGSGDMTAVRATTATLVNSEGVIEDCPYNLVSYSEEFDNAYWSKTAGVVVTSNSETSPDGTLTADTINFGASNRIVSQATTLATGVVATGSIYVKGISGQTIQLAVGGVDVLFTLNGNWQKLETTRTSVTSIFNLNTFRGATARIISVWGAQLVTGTEPKEYFPTTDRLNVPRIDYTNGSCPSILVEPQRTNLLTYSEDFANAAWTKTNVTITANSTDSPDGTTNADTLTKSGTGVDGTIVRVVSATATGYVGSIFVKKDTNTSRFPEFFLRSSNAAGENEIYVQLNTSTGATSIRLQFGTVSVSTAVLINGYWRLSFYALSNSNTCRFGIRPAAGTTLGVYDANATGSIIAWGAQLEVGSNATSYIPTVASAVTRNADVISKTGISSLINSEEGCFFVEASSFVNGGSFRLFSLSDGTTNNRITIGWSSIASTLLAFMNLGGTIVVNQNITSFNQTSNNKVLIKWGGGNFNVFVNGVNRLSLNSVTMPTANLFNKLGFDIGSSGSIFEGNVKGVLIFPTQLTDAQCISMTQL